MRFAATLLATTLVCSTLYAEGLELDFEKVTYRESGQTAPGSPKGSWSLRGRAVNNDAQSQPFSVSGLDVRILAKTGEARWTQIPSAQRYSVVKVEGVADTLAIEPGKSYSFELTVNELTQGLEPDKDYLFVVVRDEEGMGAIQYHKPAAKNE